MKPRVRYGVQVNGNYWKASVTLPNGQRRTRSIGRRSKMGKRAAMALAEQFADEIREQIGCIVPEADGLTWLDCFRQAARKRRGTKTTYNTYKATEKHLSEHFNERVKLGSLSATDAQAFRHHMVSKGLHEQTVRGHCRRAKIAWKEAKAAKLVMGDNPFDAVPTTTVKVDTEFEYIAIEDVRKIAQAVGDGQEISIMIARLAGLRLGEIARLKWEHVNLISRTISVQHKGERTTKRRARTVPICPELYERLAPIQQPEGYVAPQVIRTQGSRMYASIRTACTILGIKSDRPYQACRKSCINDWLKVLPLADVSAIAGNSPDVIMSNYHEVLASTISVITGQTDPIDTHRASPDSTLIAANAGL